MSNAGNPDKAEVIRAIQRLAEANDGVPIGRDRFIAETGISESVWKGRFWLTWGDAVREAGYEPGTMQGRLLADEDLLRCLAVFTRRIGRYPTNAHIAMERRTNADFPVAVVFTRRFGSKAKQVAALRKFIDRTPEFADVAALLPPEVDGAAVDEGDESQPSSGFVYLVKSGKYHKVGRSKDHGRRTYEIGLQLPERLEVVHTIETDDAVGIERYWHERFRDRRRNGEWFLLTKADVVAFKRRRRFM